MKAMVFTEYGPPEVLQPQEVDKPVPKDDEVLVKVHATSVNYGDLAFVRGKPFVIRLMGQGLLKPNTTILGADIAGEVEAVGAKVEQFQPGDAVFGDIAAFGFGGYAEFVAVPEHALAQKPVNLTFAEAAAVPQAAVVALQGLRDEGHIQPGQKVLINGASGGIGTFAVQIAKSFGAEVTGVCSTRNLDLVRSLGADHVIDYTQEDFVQNGQRYDLILATAGYRSIYDYKRALKPQGIYVMSGGTMAQVFQAMILGRWLSESEGRTLVNLAHEPKQEDLVYMKELVEAGQVVPVIDSCYPFNEAPEALRHYGEGHARGKVIIIITSDNA